MEQATRLQRAEERAKEFETRAEAAIGKAAKAESSFVQMDKERKAAQTELEELLLVFADMEEKVTKYKDRLKKLGENVSDGEDGVDEEGDDEDDEDEVD